MLNTLWRGDTDMGISKFPTKNIKFVAYLKLKAIHPESVVKISRGKAEYHFELDSTYWEQLKLDFDKSDFLRYAQCLDSIVDLAY
jgi:hypothetical protein